MSGLGLSAPNFSAGRDIGECDSFTLTKIWVEDDLCIHGSSKSGKGVGFLYLTQSNQDEGDVSGVAGVSGRANLNRFNPLQLEDSGLRVKQLQQQLKDIGLYL